MECPKCHRIFTNQKSFGGHLGYCLSRFESCPKCDKVLNISVLERHVSSHDKDRPCECCGILIRAPKIYCSSSCFAKKSNVGKRRHGSAPNTDPCLHCGGVKRPENTFCSSKCFSDHDSQQRLSKWLSGEDSGERVSLSYSGFMRNWLLVQFGYRCTICNLTEWNGVPIPLILDHINGDSPNNRPENLRLVCGNCDMLLPTYKNRNKGKGRTSILKKRKLPV